MRRRRRIGWACVGIAGILLIVLAILAGMTLRPWTVVPPEGVSGGAAVFVADYGHHSRLAIPAADGGSLLEYAFGDWRYYALGERGAVAAMRALFASPQATLGRRALPPIENERDYVRMTGSKRAVRLALEKTRTAELREKVEERWDAAEEAPLFQPAAGLHFIRDEQPYHLFRNSNRQIADWLQEAGCRVSGVPILANFRIRQEAGRGKASYP